MAFLDGHGAPYPTQSLLDGQSVPHHSIIFSKSYAYPFCLLQYYICIMLSLSVFF